MSDYKRATRSAHERGGSARASSTRTTSSSGGARPNVAPYGHLEDTTVVALGGLAGNAAVTHLVQRDRGAAVAPAQTTGPTRPTVEEVLEPRYPGLIPALGDQRGRFDELIDDWLDYQAFDGRIKQERVRRRMLERGRFSIPADRLGADEILRPGLPDQQVAIREWIYENVMAHDVIVEMTDFDRPSDRFRPKLTYVVAGRTVHTWDGRFTLQHLLLAFPDWKETLGAAEERSSTEMSAWWKEKERTGKGEFYKLEGKRLGEIEDWFWNTKVKVGSELGVPWGYSDDSKGRKEASAEAGKWTGSSRILVRNPADGRYHLFTTSPNLTTWDLGRSIGGKWVQLLDVDRQVPDVVEIATAEGVVLERTDYPPCWQTKTPPDMPSNLERAAVGAFFGDFFEDGGAEATFGQILIGLTPLGWIADARDIVAGVIKIWTSGGKDGKAQTAMALAGLIPVLGDLVKKGGGRLARRAIEEASPAIRRELIQKLATNPKAFKEALRRTLPGFSDEAIEELASLEKLVAEAAEGAPAARAQVSERVSGLMRALQGDASAVVAIAGGSWATVLKAIDDDALAEAMHAWRMEEFRRIEASFANEFREMEEGLGRQFEPPSAHPTGTPGPRSDLDIDLTGPRSGIQRGILIRRFETRFGPNWRRLLDADVFSDPTRLGAIGLVKGVTRAQKRLIREVEEGILRESESNILARMIMDGKPEREVEQLADMLGFDRKALAAVGERATEAKALAARPDLQHAMDLHLDALHARFEAAKLAGDVEEAAKVAGMMAKAQGRLNLATPGAYLTPGSVLSHVFPREKAFMPRGGLRVGKPIGRTSVLDDLAMVDHVASAIIKRGLSLDTVKALSKYSERLVRIAIHHGGDAAKTVEAARLLGVVANNLKLAKSPLAPLLLGSLRPEVVRATRLLVEQIDDLLLVTTGATLRSALESQRKVLEGLYGSLLEMGSAEAQARERQEAEKTRTRSRGNTTR